MTYIPKTFFIFSYFPSTFPVVAFDSCHCAKQNAKQNAAPPVPLVTRAPIATKSQNDSSVLIPILCLLFDNIVYQHPILGILGLFYAFSYTGLTINFSKSGYKASSAIILGKKSWFVIFNITSRRQFHFTCAEYFCLETKIVCFLVKEWRLTWGSRC